MRGFLDLHCHFLPSIDDGVRSEDDGVRLLRALYQVGFDHVVATPHIRTAMYENRAEGLRSAFETMQRRLSVEASTASGEGPLPVVSLAAEHFFDDVAYRLLMSGQGLPYGVGRAVLLEFSEERPPIGIEARFFELRCRRMRPVVAHPERYEPFMRDPIKTAITMRRAGGVLLLDLAAVVGKYGTKAQRVAEVLLDEHAYYAACSDAHRPADVEQVAEAIQVIKKRVGEGEIERLLSVGPKAVLAGRIVDDVD